MQGTGLTERVPSALLGGCGKSGGGGTLPGQFDCWVGLWERIMGKNLLIALWDVPGKTPIHPGAADWLGGARLGTCDNSLIHAI